MKAAQYGNVVIPQLNESFTRVNKGRRMEVSARCVEPAAGSGWVPARTAVAVGGTAGWAGGAAAVGGSRSENPIPALAAEHGLLGHGCHQWGQLARGKKRISGPFSSPPHPLGGFLGLFLVLFYFGLGWVGWFFFWLYTHVP